MNTIKVQLKDTHTICPVSGREFLKALKAGDKVQLARGENTQTFTIKGGTEYMAWVNEGKQLGEFLNGASKSTPVEVEISLEQ